MQTGKEVEFITAIADVKEFDLYDIRCFTKHFPDKWIERESIKRALAQTLKQYYHRFCMDVTRSRNYEILPLSTSCELTGVNEDVFIDEVLNALGEYPETLNTTQLFSLIGLLQPKLTENEALDALTFGLDLFENVLEDTDGDGPWSLKLKPPDEIEGSIAGYIWSCLASPRSTLRWEAAHVVHALSTYGCKKILDYLISFAEGKLAANAFYDNTLHFYEMHALQWLLIGLARSALDYPSIIAPYVEFLKSITFHNTPHVIIQEYSKKALQALIDAKTISPQDDFVHQLMRINTSPFSFDTSKKYPRFEKYNEECSEPDLKNDNSWIHFSIDMAPYWFDPLGKCFAKSQASIEREALTIIKNEWKMPFSFSFEDDPRHRKKVFNILETHHSHGSYPRVDELNFYLSYHAMMQTASKLLATTPVQKNLDENIDEFTNWISNHTLSRIDGKWLSDRRDPIPCEWPLWKNNEETDNWRWSIARNDFDCVLQSPNGRINLRGNWKWILGHREETISVSSAFVSSKNSLALLQALQNVEKHWEYQIPDYDSDDDTNSDICGFQCRSWIKDQSRIRGLDDKDPWSGDIMYPPPQPAPFIVNLMNLSHDAEHRRWFVEGDCKDVAWAQTWGQFRDKIDDDENYENGYRFQASLDFIKSLLCKVGMDLIVEVQIERQLYYKRWERKSSIDLAYIPPSIRRFIIKADGSISSI